MTTAKRFSAQKQRQIAHRGLLSSDISHQPSVGLKINWEERFVGVSVFSLVKKVFRAQELTKKPFVATSATKKLSKPKYKPPEHSDSRVLNSYLIVILYAKLEKCTLKNNTGPHHTFFSSDSRIYMKNLHENFPNLHEKST